MRSGKSLVFMLLLLALPLIARASDSPSTTPPTAAPAPSHRHKKAQRKAPPPLVLPPLPSGPLNQVPMDQIPASAPTVTFEKGLLTISARNATLGEILREVRKLTNASIDIPPGGAGERVVTNLGPGSPREVLAKLLDGASYNYVILGSASDATVIATVILTPKPTGAAPAEVQTVAYQPPQPQMPPVRVPQGFRGAMLPQNVRQGGDQGATPAAGAAAASDDAEDSDSDDKDDDSDQSAQPTPGQAAVSQPDPNNANSQADQPAADGNQPNAGPKTPEQLLEMIRRGQPMVPPQGQPGGQTPPPQE